MRAEVRHFEGSGDLCVGDFGREGGLLLEVCCVKAKLLASAAIGCLNLFSCYIDPVLLAAPPASQQCFPLTPFQQ